MTSKIGISFYFGGRNSNPDNARTEPVALSGLGPRASGLGLCLGHPLPRGDQEPILTSKIDDFINFGRQNRYSGLCWPILDSKIGFRKPSYFKLQNNLPGSF